MSHEVTDIQSEKGSCHGPDICVQDVGSLKNSLSLLSVKCTATVHKGQGPMLCLPKRCDNVGAHPLKVQSQLLSNSS
jgi:hypothetical protein